MRIETVEYLRDVLNAVSGPIHDDWVWGPLVRNKGITIPELYLLKRLVA